MQGSRRGRPAPSGRRGGRGAPGCRAARRAGRRHRPPVRPGRAASSAPGAGAVLPAAEAAVAADQALERRDLLGARVDEAVDVDVRRLRAERDPAARTRVLAGRTAPAGPCPRPRPSSSRRSPSAPSTTGPVVVASTTTNPTPGCAARPVDQGREARVELLPGQALLLAAHVDQAEVARAEDVERSRRPSRGGDLDVLRGWSGRVDARSETLRIAVARPCPTPVREVVDEDRVRGPSPRRCPRTTATSAASEPGHQRRRGPRRTGRRTSRPGPGRGRRAPRSGSAAAPPWPPSRAGAAPRRPPRAPRGSPAGASRRGGRSRRSRRSRRRPSACRAACAGRPARC